MNSCSQAHKHVDIVVLIKKQKQKQKQFQSCLDPHPLENNYTIAFLY